MRFAVSIPESELSAFARLPVLEQARVSFWLGALQPAFHKKRGVIACLREIAAREGVVFGTALRLYYQARDHGWRGLVTMHHRQLTGVPTAHCSLPTAR